MSVIIFEVTILLALVHSNNGGCDVNDWPHSCLANFRIGKQRCEPCESGTYGCNCTESCPDNTYGPGCYTFCNCPEDEFCDPMVGCINYTLTTQQATDKVNRSITAIKDINSTPLQNIDRTTRTTTTLKNDFSELSSFKIVGISIATSMPMVILSIVLSVLFSRRKSRIVAVNQDFDVKSTNEDLPEAEEQNNDTHSYLTISDRSDRLYAAVHYDEAEERKSSSPISLRSITEQHTNSDSENSKTSESYLTPLVETADELIGDRKRSSDYEDVTVFKM